MIKIYYDIKVLFKFLVKLSDLLLKLVHNYKEFVTNFVNILNVMMLGADALIIFSAPEF